MLAAGEVLWREERPDVFSSEDARDVADVDAVGDRAVYTPLRRHPSGVDLGAHAAPAHRALLPDHHLPVRRVHLDALCAGLVGGLCEDGVDIGEHAQPLRPRARSHQRRQHVVVGEHFARRARIQLHRTRHRIVFVDDGHHAQRAQPRQRVGQVRVAVGHEKVSLCNQHLRRLEAKAVEHHVVRGHQDLLTGCSTCLALDNILHIGDHFLRQSHALSTEANSPTTHKHDLLPTLHEVGNLFHQCAHAR
mmetsp:Transcript_50897/g.102060  ORF Transcript_50897/g.102060 Transcript_50897/m.102060 type:complete len:248 (-) Transcript_50897:251-994(-)